MELKINCSNGIDPCLCYVMSCLPSEICERLLLFLQEKKIATVNEIRIHADTSISLLYKDKIAVTDIFVSKKEVEEIVLCLCGGSLYAHADSIKEGYISIGKGARAGICGKAVVEDGKICGVRDITSVILRIPQKIPFAGDYIYSFLKSKNFYCSVIIYSAPGVGKTTILRDLICRLSKNTALRFAVIDTREEITPFLSSDELSGADVYLAYPKGLGIELATKSMTPQLIICDEIASMNESNAVIKSSNSGVSLVATTHSRTFSELCSKEIFKPLLKGGIFDYAIGIARSDTHLYSYELNKLK